MQDFCLEQGTDSTFDMAVDEDTKDFFSTGSFETSFNFQLFVDQRVSQEERANPLDRRGWIGDMQTRNESYQVGSILHLQEQSRDTTPNNNESAAYAKNALEYFVILGATKEVSAAVVGSNIEGTITNRANDISRYSSLWKSPIVCN